MRLVSRSNHLRGVAINRCGRERRDPLPTTTHTLFPDLDIVATVAQVRQKGFVTGIHLPQDVLLQIRNFCGATQALDDITGEPLAIDLQDETLPVAGHLAYRCPNPHKLCEAVDKLTRDASIVAVARGYLDREPLLRSSRIFWSYPDPSPAYNPLYGFHYDIDDYKFLKVFFYLCDVNTDRGPHVIIEGTHGKKDWFAKNHRRLTDEDAERRYKDRIRVMTGKAGTGFFEDTFCYHKGSKPKQRRLILEFQYAISRAAVL
jgi:hypothetical protein